MPLVDSVNSLSLKPLGAGDLIDAAVRLYRRNVAVFMLTAAPPVVIASALAVGWLYLTRTLASPGTSGDTFLYGLAVAVGSIAIWFIEIVASFVVMGGASRNFVRHLLFDEPITVAATYADVARRPVALAIASTIVAVILSVAFFVVLYIALIAAAVLIGATAFLLGSFPAVIFVLAVVQVIAVTGGALWLFCLIASRVMFVPQAILVEGLSVGAAFGRSVSLASGSVLRLMALVAFTTVAAIAALSALYVPIVWYAWANGVELFQTGREFMPAWLEVAASLVGQLSFILLSPVWMIGMSLMYVDERVRGEGYDIELLATRRLGDIPSVPMNYTNPLQPAIATGRAAPPQITLMPATGRTPEKQKSILGLDT